MARDWSKAFWNCSFNGFPFWVDVDELSGGRRVSVSMIAYRDQPVTEDFGALPARQIVTGYLASDDVDVEAVAFGGLLQLGGSGLLILPLGITGIYRLETFARIREKDRNGFVAFDLEFVTAGLGAIPFVAGAIVPRLSALGAAGSAGALALGTLF